MTTPSLPLPRSVLVLVLALAGGLSGCLSNSNSGRIGQDAADAAPADASSPVDASGPDAPSPVDGALQPPDIPSAECAGSGPTCTFGCGGDAFVQGECVDGRWQCPNGTTPMDECPPGSCFGLPERGEVCTDQGWECRPWEVGALPACGAPAERVCLDCAGFPATHETPRCDCTCEGGRVQCGEPPECRAGTASTNFGVTLRIELEQCAFTSQELAAGVTLGYTVVLEDHGTYVWSKPLDAGRCDQPGASGLRVQERIQGDGQQWCVCDTGLCMDPVRVDQLLVDGTYQDTIQWDGRNWQGPSDTGNTPGDRFPPGDYLFVVRAAGFFGDAPGVNALWDITATAPVYVLD